MKIKVYQADKKYLKIYSVIIEKLHQSFFFQ